jgi:hypothetical protein
MVVKKKVKPVNKVKKKVTPVKKVKKNPTKVKKPSSYNIYQKLRYSILKKEYFTLPFTEINKLISAEWKTKTTDEKAKFRHGGYLATEFG